ncbi:MAG: caspase family protein [Blastocatellia bacterium]|nr:caspase family protein [Blastocatellia bacterium]
MKCALFIKLITVSLLLFWPDLPKVDAGSQEQSERALKTKAEAASKRTIADGKAQLWAVIIGVSLYKNGDRQINDNRISNLKYAADDAQSIFDFLRSPEGGGFVPQSEGGRMILLKDERATRLEVERALDLLKQSKPEDYFIIYIAAHGALAPLPDPVSKRTLEVPYFVLYDSDLDDLPGTGIEMQALRQLISEIPARKGLVLADACHSAGVQMAGRGLRVSIRANSRFIEEMRNIPPGIAFISASDQTESSYESDELSRGFFTHCLLEGLGGIADSDLDGIVTFEEMKNHLRDCVRDLSDGKQTPVWSTTSVGVNQLGLSVTPYAHSGTGSEYGLLTIRTPDIDGVEVAVDGLPMVTLDSRTPRTLKIKAGPRNLSFRKEAMQKAVQVTVEPGKSKTIEVNLSFSEEGEDDPSIPFKRRTIVFLSEDREPSKKARDLFLKGVEKFNKQDFNDAIDLLNRAVDEGGGAYREALVYRGRAEQSLSRQMDAVASFEAALALRPSDYETRALLADAKFRAGFDVEEVASELKSIIRNHPEFEEARVIYADVLLSRKEYIAAERQLMRAINSNPRYPAAYMALADVLTFSRSKEKLRQAIEAADKSLELFDELSRKHLSFARGLKRMSISHVIFGGGRYVNRAAMAESHYHKAQAISLLVEQGHAQADRDAYLDEARRNIEAAMKLIEGLPRKTRSTREVLLFEASARNHLLKGDLARAIRDAERSLKAGRSLPFLKDYPDAHYTLFLAYRSSQKFRKAAEHLQNYIEASGSHLDPDERKGLEDELRRLRERSDTIRQ